MDTASLVRQFDRIGARVAIQPLTQEHNLRRVRLNILRDKYGEYFDLQIGLERDLRVVDAQPDLRHLLLLSTTIGGRADRSRFLCGHDERHWFVASVPNLIGVSGVRTAMEALKPRGVLEAQNRKRLSPRDRITRRNNAFIRQGEWFFVATRLHFVNPYLILKNEPIRRGRGKPHLIEELYRTGGETVYVSNRNPNGITEQEYTQLILQRPRLARLNWRVMRRNMRVYARGRVRHPDHATIKLDSWHEVHMNTEGLAQGSTFVAFLD